jgi:LPXTG-motif cell wall-anchored protein
MAATSASGRWAFARRAAATSAVAAAGLVALAIPASAHVPSANAGCDKDTSKPTVSVSFMQYRLEDGKPTGKPNSVTVVEVTKDGEKALANESFGVELVKTYKFDKLDGRVAHTFKVTAMAFDDQDKEHPQGWSKIFKDLKSGICDKTETTTTPPSHSTPPPVSSPSSSAPAVVPPVTTTPPAVGANASLASTGATIALPLAIGALLVVGGGVLLLLRRRRGKE